MGFEKELAKIVCRCQDGDRAAFQELFEIYQPRLQYYLRRLDSGSNVDDVLQDIWLVVIKKIHKSGQIENPIEGKFLIIINGKQVVAEYVADTELRDSEQVPLIEEGGIETFFKREILPIVSDAWVDNKSTKIGYEVSFTKYFYKPKKLRTLDEIKAEIKKTEKESEGLLKSILDVSVAE